MKANDTLMKLLPKLEITEFIGLARILKVKLIEEVNPDAAEAKDRYQPRQFSDVFADMMEAFDSAPRARKREIIQLVKAATKKGDKS